MSFIPMTVMKQINFFMRKADISSKLWLHEVSTGIILNTEYQ